MNCREAGRRLPGYVDGAISTGDHARLRRHLEACGGCRMELDRYHRLMNHLAKIERVAPPRDLAVQIRIRAAQAVGALSFLRHARDRAVLGFDNFLRPFAVPATGGVLTALVVFVFLVQSILTGVPLGGVVPNDLPLNLIQPARLESLAPFPVPGLDATEGHSGSGLLLVEATLNAQGQVVSYQILSGPHTTAVERQIDQMLLFSRFRPQFSFGRPTDGGHVLLSFSEVRVRG
jgi:hypothetical protein